MGIPTAKVLTSGFGTRGSGSMRDRLELDRFEEPVLEAFSHNLAVRHRVEVVVLTNLKSWNS